MKIPGVKGELTFNKSTGKLIHKRKEVKKTYTANQVNRLLREQKKLCSIVPLLNKSRGSEDSKEWNKFLTNMSKAVKGLPNCKLNID